MSKLNPFIQRKGQLDNGAGRKEKGETGETVFRRNICTLSKVRGTQKKSFLHGLAALGFPVGNPTCSPRRSVQLAMWSVIETVLS
jgi:hypothetical protein